MKITMGLTDTHFDSGALSFRLATHDDTVAVVALVNSSYRYDKDGWTSESSIVTGDRVSKSLYSDSINDTCTTEVWLMQYNSTVATAYDDIEMGRIKDYVSTDKSSNIIACIQLQYNDNSISFGMFAVAPVLQSIGIGKHVLNYIESIARDKKMQSIKLSVITMRKELYEYYARRGYHPIDVKPFPYDDDRLGVPIIGDLTFTEMEKKILS